MNVNKKELGYVQELILGIYTHENLKAKMGGIETQQGNAPRF